MNMQNVIWGLEELSDRDYQERVWLGNSPGEMSTFEEAVCQTFNDSGFGAVLDSERKRAELSPVLRELGMKLRRLLKKVPYDLSPLEEINHPAMKDVRETAKEMLVVLKA